MWWGVIGLGLGLEFICSIVCLCEFLDIDIPSKGCSNNVNEYDDKVKEEDMIAGEKCSGNNGAVMAEPIALQQRSRKSSKSKNSKHKRWGPFVYFRAVVMLVW